MNLVGRGSGSSANAQQGDRDYSICSDQYMVAEPLAQRVYFKHDEKKAGFERRLNFDSTHWDLSTSWARLGGRIGPKREIFVRESWSLEFRRGNSGASPHQVLSPIRCFLVVTVIVAFFPVEKSGKAR